MADPMFRVDEHVSHFTVRHIPTQRERAMGDGVDFDFGTEGKPLTVGMEGFREAWEKSLNSDPDTLEAYFPEVIEREKHRDDIEHEFIELIRKAEKLGVQVEVVVYKENNPVGTIYLNTDNLQGNEQVPEGKEPEPDVIFNVDWDKDI